MDKAFLAKAKEALAGLQHDIEAMMHQNPGDMKQLAATLGVLVVEGNWSVLRQASDETLKWCAMLALVELTRAGVAVQSLLGNVKN